MSKKKLAIGILTFILILLICSMGIKVDETGVHAVINWGNEIIKIF